MKVTITGVDERTDINELVRLKEKYEFLEFGVLMSKNNTGTNENNRYPSFEYIDKLLNAGIPLSGHICGKLARDFMKTGNFDDIREFLTTERIKGFDRFQFNIRGFDGYTLFHVPEDIKIIIQVSDCKSYNYFYSMNERIDNEGRVSALMDSSGGTGKLGFFDVIANEDEYVGYAGGISIDNISYILGYIYGRNECNKDYWIDMESSVRTEDWLDISKVEKICENVAKWLDIVDKIS